MRKHPGSTVALVLGTLSFAGGVNPPNNGMFAGIFIILGALAYRSAKKRVLGDVENSASRRAFEYALLATIVAMVVLQNNAMKIIETDPVPFLCIPLWAFVAYTNITRRMKQI